MILLKWSHKCNIADVYYQTGFSQCVYLDANWDYPLIESTEVVKADLNGDDILKYYNQTQRCSFQVCGIPDTWISPLTLIRAHSDIELIDIETGEKFSLKDFRFTSTPDGTKCTSLGTFSFLAERIITSSCCEEDELIKN